MNVRVQIGEKLGVASLQILCKIKNVQQENSMLKRQSEHFRAGVKANYNIFDLECQLQQMPLDCDSGRTESDVVSDDLKKTVKNSLKTRWAGGSALRAFKNGSKIYG